MFSLFLPRSDTSRKDIKAYDTHKLSLAVSVTPVKKIRWARLENRQWKHISTDGYRNTTASENRIFPLAVGVTEPPLKI
jgi:hypothetical protein